MIEKTMQAAKKRRRLGELLVDQGLINTNQLKDALKRQAQVGGQLGSILVEMEYISTDDLLSFLSKQFGIPSANLLEKEIVPEVLKVMPLEKIKAMKVLPISINEGSITLAMVNPRDVISIKDIEFSLGKKVVPVVVPSSQMEAAIQSLELHPESILSGEELKKEVRKTEREKAPPLTILLKYLSSSPATDMLLTAGVPPGMKLGNDLSRISTDPLTPYDCERYARELLSEEDWELFVDKGDHNIAITYPEIGRFRSNFYRQRNSISIALRRIMDILPSLEELGLPDWVKEYVLMPQGLILISSPSGHGKTTTLAAMVDIINSGRRCNIVTLEDPIEYLHKHKKSNVNQREIGSDTKSYGEGLKHIFRQDPDVIAIDEMKDVDSAASALQAADTGHLVLATVHASTAASAIESIINVFPPHQQEPMKTRLADTLLFVLSQRLVLLKQGEGRELAYEKLINNHTVKNLIRDGKTYQIRSQVLNDTDDYTPLETSLTKLYLSGLIKYEEGLRFSGDKQFYKDLTKTA